MTGGWLCVVLGAGAGFLTGACGSRSNLGEGRAEAVAGAGGNASSVGPVSGAQTGGVKPEPCASDGESERGPRLICVPGGSFTLGDPDVTSDVRAGVEVGSFWMDATEVTVAQYRQCVSDHSCSLPGDGGKCTWSESVADREQHPVNCVDVRQAQAFCEWAGKTLPSVEQWEFAARGPGTSPRIFPWGNEAPSEQLCWNRMEGSCPVGDFEAGDTPLGLKDMAGNVRELSLSCPDGNVVCSVVALGGSWITTRDSYLRSGFPFVTVQDHQRTRVTGFRCIRPDVPEP